MTKKNALILGSTKGIGNAFYRAAKRLDYDVNIIGKNIYDTRSIGCIDDQKISSFIANLTFDAIVLNTGGMQPLELNESSPLGEVDMYRQAFQMYFLSFLELLSNIKISDNAKIFYISTHVVHNYEARLMHSAVARSSFELLLKTLPKLLHKPQLEVLSLRFGPVATDRLINLIESSGKTLEQVVDTMPRKRIANLNDVEKLATYLFENGSTLIGSEILNLDLGIQQKG